MSAANIPHGPDPTITGGAGNVSLPYSKSKSDVLFSNVASIADSVESEMCGNDPVIQTDTTNLMSCFFLASTLFLKILNVHSE